MQGLIGNIYEEKFKKQKKINTMQKKTGLNDDSKSIVWGIKNNVNTLLRPVMHAVASIKEHHPVPALGVLLFMFFNFHTFAQTGIDNNDPDTTAALHVGARDSKQGLLIPARANTSGISVENIKESLMFYTSDKKTFVFWDGDSWQSLNPWEAVHHIDTITTTKHIVANKTTKEQGTKYKIQQNNQTGTPMAAIGSIIMWSGDPATLPRNWKLCNGGKYYEPISGDSLPIPDLSGKFVVGYDDSDTDYNTIGATGPPTDASDYDVIDGGKKISLKKTSMPVHNHSLIHHNHSHDNNIESGSSLIWETTKYKKDASLFDLYEPPDTLNYEIIIYGYELPHFPHHHPVLGSIKKGYAYITTNHTGFNHPHENRPPYYTLAYIIRVW